MATQVVKLEQVRHRVEMKRNSGIVVYKIASSDEQDVYEVTLYNGRFSSCTCPAHQKNGVECWPARTALAKEAEVQARRRQEEAEAMAVVSAEMRAAPVAAAPTTSERFTRAALNRRELRFENGILMR